MNGEIATTNQDPLAFQPIALLQERIEDQEIIEYLRGQAIENYVYHFTAGGKEIWGLSKAGVDEACSELAKQNVIIREIDLKKIEETEDFIVWQVTAGKYKVGIHPESGKQIELLLETAIGIKRQLKKFPNGKPFEFYYEAGAMKAARNAKKRLIPEKIILEVIKFAQGKGKVKEVRPETGNEDEKWTARNKAMFAELKKKYPDDWEPRYRKLLKDEFKVESTKELNLFQLDVIIQKIKAGQLPEPDQQGDLV